MTSARKVILFLGKPTDLTRQVPVRHDVALVVASRRFYARQLILTNNRVADQREFTIFKD